MNCSIGYFAYDDELCHKPIHRPYIVHSLDVKWEFFKAKRWKNKLNVACGRRVSHVLVKLMLWQSLSSPFYIIVKQKITRSTCVYPLTLVHVCILIEVVKAFDGGVCINNPSSDIEPSPCISVTMWIVYSNFHSAGFLKLKPNTFDCTISQKIPNSTNTSIYICSNSILYFKA